MGEKYLLNDHKSCVLSMKFANSGKACFTTVYIVCNVFPELNMFLKTFKNVFTNQNLIKTKCFYKAKHFSYKCFKYQNLVKNMFYKPECFLNKNVFSNQNTI